MRVMARGYRDRPLDRAVVCSGDKVTYVANLSARGSAGITAGDGVGFPTHCVFRFERDLFDSLCGAWERRDAERLADLWARATPAPLAGDQSPALR